MAEEGAADEQPPAAATGPIDAEARRIAWIKHGVCDGLNLEGKYFDDLLRHPVDGPQLKAFLKEEPLSAESWLLLYAATELEGVEEKEEEEEAAPPPPASPEEEARLAELAEAIKKAAKDGDADEVGALLADGVPVDVQDDAGYTPLVSGCPGRCRCQPSHLPVNDRADCCARDPGLSTTRRCTTRTLLSRCVSKRVPR